MPRARQSEMPIEGPGVSVPRIAAIDRLADQLDDVLEEKATLATKVTELEGKLIEKMEEHGLKKYRYRDREVIYKPGKIHVKLKTVKNEGKDSEGGEEPPTE